MTTFHGATFEPARDHARLANQLERIRSLMLRSGWLDVAAIAAITNDPEPSVSAQLRNLRKPQNGGHIVERRYIAGVFEYRVLPLGAASVPPSIGKLRDLQRRLARLEHNADQIRREIAAAVSPGAQQ